MQPFPTRWPCRRSELNLKFAERLPLAFVPVEPTAVAEVEVDTVLDGPFGRVRHRGRLVRIRLDLHPEDVITGSAEAYRSHEDGGTPGPLARAGRR